VYFAATDEVTPFPPQVRYAAGPLVGPIQSGFAYINPATSGTQFGRPRQGRSLPVCNSSGRLSRPRDGPTSTLITEIAGRFARHVDVRHVLRDRQDTIVILQQDQ
jgi:hypothetical protein